MLSATRFNLCYRVLKKSSRYTSPEGVAGHEARKASAACSENKVGEQRIAESHWLPASWAS